MVDLYIRQLKCTKSAFAERLTKKFFGDKVYNTKIPRTVKLMEAPSFGKPVILYDKNCKGTESYLDFATEFLQRQNVVTNIEQ